MIFIKRGFHNAVFRKGSGFIKEIKAFVSVHTTAQEGFTQGPEYDKSRPSYSDELVNHVIRSLHTGSEFESQHDVLELGAGTGKFTRKILAHLKTPVRYLATEPSAGFCKTFKTLVPNVDVQQCDASKIPLKDSTVQNIVCAQSFHWFADEVNLDEMSRTLVPGGRVLLVWNNKDWNVEWVKAIEGILTGYYGNTPRAVTRQWKTVLESYKDLQLVEHTFLPGIQNMVGSKDFVIDHFSSISVIARLDSEEKKKVKDEFRAVLDKYFNDQETINIPFLSEFYCVKKPK